MLNELLKELEEKGFDVEYASTKKMEKLILVDLAKEIIKKHLTKENCKLWLSQEQNENTKN